MYSILAAVVVLAVGLGVFYRRQKRQRQGQEIRLSVSDLNQKISRGDAMTIIDLRHPLDVLASPQAIPGATCIKPDDVNNRTAQVAHDSEVVLYCTCPNEETSLKAYEQMKKQGFQNLKVLEGGLPAWKEAKLPLQDLYPDVTEQMKR